jgi:hypothetical protein
MPDEVHGEFPPTMGQPAIHVTQGYKTEPRVILTSGGKSYLMEQMVDGMIRMGEAVALAIEVFEHPTTAQVAQARRALEHAVAILEGAEVK